MIVAMLAVLVTWLVVLLVCSGIGLSLQRIAGRSELDGPSAISGCWLGWSGLIAGLQVMHLFLPVGTLVRVMALAVGVGGLLWNRSRILQFLRARGSVAAWSLLALCGVSVWLANRAMQPIGPYDAGLYHLQSIKWASSFPIVPGLGNLHSRFAFNSSYFLYEALFDLGSPDDAIPRAASGPLILVAAAQVGLSCYRMLTKRSHCRACDVFGIAFAAPVLHYGFSAASSASPDLPAFVLGFAVGLQLCEMLFADGDRDELAYDVSVIAFVSAVSISVKASNLVYGALATLSALLVLLTARAAGQRFLLAVGKRIGSMVLPLGVMTTWLVRGVILSGFALYPSMVLAVGAEWQVPPEQAAIEARWIRSWARQPHSHPDEVLSGWGWLGPWAARVLGEEVTGSTANLFLPLVMGLLSIGLMGRGVQVQRRRVRYVLLLMPAIGSLLFWFMTAPEPRFVGAAGWHAAAATLVVAVHRSPQRSKWLHATLTAAMLAALVLVIHAMTQGIWVTAYPGSGVHPIPVPDTERFVTDSGLVLYVPSEGDQCWDAPLPCTPYPNSNLVLRQEGELGGGFLVSSH